MSHDFALGVRRGASGIAAVLLFVACGAQRCAREASPSDLHNSPADSPEDLVDLLETLDLPPGFAIELYTADVPNARSLALGAPGVTYVGTREDHRVYAVVDHDGDHRVDEVVTIAEGLDTPNGVAYRDGDLWVAENSRILRFPDIDERLHNPPEPEVITAALPTETHHGWRYIGFGPDGRLYVSVGAPCNVCLSDAPIFASIARIDPDGGDLEVFAHGIRNSVGFDWHPQTGELWFTDNGRDWLGPDQPPDELNPDFGEGYSCDEFEPPVQELGPHVAALGMRFYTGGMFPDRYRNAAIIAEHGSWNRPEKIGYRIMVVPLEQATPLAYEPLVDGFLDADAGEAWGRPVDVAVLDDGSLLISDDLNGAIYRVSY